MKCPNCGIPLAGSEEKCPACEAELTEFKKKRKKKILIGFSIIMLLVIAGLVFFVIYRANNRYNGRYDYVPDEEIQKYLDALGKTMDDMDIHYYIELDGDSFRMVNTSSTGEDVTEGTFTIEEGAITLKSEKITYRGTYSSKDKTITIKAGDSITEFKRK